MSPGFCFFVFLIEKTNCGGHKPIMQIFFGTESASRMRSEIQLLCMTCDCHEVKTEMVTQLNAECGKPLHPTSACISNAMLFLPPLRTVPSPLSFCCWGFCAVIHGGTTANNEKPVSHSNDSIVWCQ